MSAPKETGGRPTCRRPSSRDDWIVLSSSLLTVALMMFIVLIS